MLASDFISEIALLFVSDEDFDTQLNKAMAAIGKQFSVSRCYFFIDSADGLTADISHEWCAKGVARRIPDSQKISYSAIPALKNDLEKQKVFVIGDIAAQKSEIRELLGLRKVCSLMIAPIVTGGRVTGFFGFDECKQTREWTPAETEALKTLAGIIAIAYSGKRLTTCFRKGFEDQQKRFQSILEGAKLGTWEWNIETGEMVFNERWAEMIGYKLSELTPSTMDTWKHFLHPDDLAESGRLMNLHFQGNSDFYECESRMHHKNGSWIWVLDRGEVFERDVHDRPLKMYGIHADITEKKNMEQQIRELSIRDPLTGVYSRRYIFERLNAIAAEYSRRGRNFCVSILDIDHFKQVNETYGHLAGDFVLKEFALTISSTIRQYDLLGRYGGEEFIVITSSATGSETAAMLTRVMGLIRGNAFIYTGHKIRFTFSCGIVDSSEFTHEAFSGEAMIALADKRLNAAKEAGGNRCIGS